MIWLLLACTAGPSGGSDADGDGATDERPASCATEPDVTWDGWTHGFVTTYCAACHTASAPERHDAPTGLDLDTAAQAWTNRDAIRDAVLTRATMPPGGGVLDADLELFTAWLDCSGGR